MKNHAATLILVLVLWLAACAPAAPVQQTELPAIEATTRPVATVELSTPSLDNPSKTVPVEETDAIVTQAEAAPETPAPALTEWELVLQTVEAYRNRLERSSDGYQGLTIALEQTEPNEAWCGGLNAAIGDFSYINDEESAGALRDLQESQGCS